MMSVRLAAPIVLAMILLAACGFQLKGRQDYAFKRLYIEPSGMVSPAMTARLKRMIQAGSDTLVVNEVRDAEVIFSISTSRNQRALSLTAQGVVEEYELVSTVTYALTSADGMVLIPSSMMRLNRSMTYSDRYTLAKQTESELLYRDMENDAIDQLMRRLALVNKFKPVNESVPVVQPRAPLPPPPL